MSAKDGCSVRSDDIGGNGGYIWAFKDLIDISLQLSS